MYVYIYIIPIVGILFLFVTSIVPVSVPPALIEDKRQHAGATGCD